MQMGLFLPSSLLADLAESIWLFIADKIAGTGSTAAFH